MGRGTRGETQKARIETIRGDIQDQNDETREKQTDRERERERER